MPNDATPIFSDIQAAQLPGPTFLTIGNFDGLHRGHQALIRRLQEEARQDGRPGARTALLTFDPHPLALLRPDLPLQLLTSPQERVALALELGVDVGIVQPFTHEIAALSPREFMQRLVDHVGLAGLVVGPDFALGRNRSGTLDVLTALGQELGYRVIVIDPVAWEGEEVRSLAIRRHLLDGNVAQAQMLLGRFYRLPGEVVSGDGRGRTIGVPTANLLTPSDRLLPANGVYATWAWLGTPGQGRRFASATNVGVRPTVDGTQRRVETHLLDFPPSGQSGDLYGQVLTIAFVERLRGEQKFESLQALVAQIQADLVQARQVLATESAQHSLA